MTHGWDGTLNVPVEDAFQTLRFCPRVSGLPELLVELRHRKKGPGLEEAMCLNAAATQTAVSEVIETFRRDGDAGRILGVNNLADRNGIERSVFSRNFEFDRCLILVRIA